jgi:drug/metabolite transporter (DMT)-like permease
LLRDQRINAWRVAGLLLGFSGVWLILSTQQLDLGAGVTEGKIAIVVSAFLWALAMVLNKKRLPTANAMMMTGMQLLAGGVFLLPVSMLAERTAPVLVTPASSAVFLIMLFGQGVTAYFCYYYLMSKVSPTSVALLSFVTPSIAVLLGVILMHEPVYWQMGAGLALVAAGILTVNMLGQRQRAVA